ncbi:hypothetical protein [Hungatella effluvii]|uniref:hypothetical protein n=1 Tax=Hungatella effluvii TaxID=1096246 RepID=UPI0011B530CA|nr:hypothetical protein [Hungatella effluvii]
MADAAEYCVNPPFKERSDCTSGFILLVTDLSKTVIWGILCKTQQNNLINNEKKIIFDDKSKNSIISPWQFFPYTGETKVSPLISFAY